MTAANPLINFQGQVKLTNAHPDIIKEVQKVLKEIELYKGEVDGIAGKNTIAAFTIFKQKEYLENPEILGRTTAQALLDAIKPHPTPVDLVKAPVKIEGRVVAVPGVGLCWTGDPVYEGSNFTWGEMTKNLTRVPKNAKITHNIRKLAAYLDKVRQYLGHRPIKVNSAYRPPAINKAVGGVSNSRHIYGDAADIVIEGLDPHEVYVALNKWHGDNGGLGDSWQFTHVDLRGFKSRFSYG